MENPYQAPTASPDDEPRGPDREPGPRVPTVVTVLGVIGIVFGTLKLLCAPFNVIGYLMPVPKGQVGNPAIQLLADPTYRSFLLVMVVFDGIAGAALLTASIGLLGLRPWARRLAIGYSAYAIVATLVNIAFTAVFLIAPIVKTAQQKGNAESVGAAVGSAVGGLIGTCLALVFPILLLVFMYRPRIVQAFQPPAFEVDEPPLLPPL